MIERLRKTLINVSRAAGSDFSGVGIIVHHPDAGLPVFPLRLDTFEDPGERIDDFLAKISSRHSDYHDGFHLISTEWNITAVSQYFSPPIVASATINRQRAFGGRYLAAQFGSFLPGVELCGVASLGFGLAIFKAGIEVHFEKLEC